MTCPCVTLEPSSTVTSASRPGYFDETSTCVASMRPFDLTMPAGSVSPRRRAIRLRSLVCAWAGGNERASIRLPEVPGQQRRAAEAQEQGGRGRNAPMVSHHWSPAHVTRSRRFASRTRNVRAQQPLRPSRDAAAKGTSSRRRPCVQTLAALLGKHVHVVKNERGRECMAATKRKRQRRQDTARERLGSSGEAQQQSVRARTGAASCANWSSCSSGSFTRA